MVQAARELRRSATPTEQVLWTALRRKALGGLKIRRQQPIGPFVVDFFVSERRLVIEIDGAVHETQVERDHERQAALESLGLTVMRFRADDVEHDLDGVLKRIGEAVSR